MGLFTREYRIVRDNYAGWEVQFRTVAWPFWRQVDFANTHRSLEDAENFARRDAEGCPSDGYLGRLVGGEWTGRAPKGQTND